MPTDRGDELFNHIVAGGNGEAANDLLGEFYQGYPLERLRALLHAQNDEAVRTGAFIASELGRRFAPLLDETPRLLEHPIDYVRSDALDVVLMNATASSHGDLLAQAVLLVQDPHSGVRFKALRFLAGADIEQLRAARDHSEHPVIVPLLAWLINAATQPVDTEEILARLGDDDALIRRFAAVLAARTSNLDVNPLEQAVTSADSEVASFAKAELEVFRLQQKRR